ncbi:Tripartite-type tricarboxylate transporter, receptor component TctC [Variovorax sp. YR216]|nr:Tripartite-type tricarboxylate transporter, receptor component TctC [Variovorax sp. YR216]
MHKTVLGARRLFLAAGLALCVPAFAQGAATFPNKPIRMIVPFTPGGGSDAAARFFGEKLSAALGQPVLVDNRPGGNSGSIGTTFVKSQPADGYTLLLGSTAPLVTNVVMVKDLPYDAAKDFKPVAGLTKNMTAIVVPPGSPYRTLAELVAASKKSALNAGTASEGFHLAADWFASSAGFKYTHVPYKGLTQVLTDVAGGYLDWAIVDLAGATPLLQGHRIRALAVTDEARHPFFSRVPTVKESGYPEFVYNTWTSIHVRSDTPDDITGKLAEATMKIVASDAARAYAQKAGTQLLPLGSEEFAKYQREEVERFQKVAESSGIKPE